MNCYLSKRACIRHKLTFIAINERFVFWCCVIKWIIIIINVRKNEQWQKNKLSDSAPVLASTKQLNLLDLSRVGNHDSNVW